MIVEKMPIAVFSIKAIYFIIKAHIMLIRNMAERHERELEPLDAPQDAVLGELTNGLLQTQAQVSPKYLYDVLGSKLFEAICELPEYYPTRTEASIFSTHLQEIAQAIGHGSTLIDLGAGNCAKAEKLFSELRPSQYVAVDISADFLHSAVGALRQRHPQIAMLEVALDFSESLDLPPQVKRDKRLFFYPGSSIGNFTPMQARAFLRRIRNACHTHAADGNDGGLLIGVDLIKDNAVLDAAYDDALGVTASFNLNLLRHLNHLIGTDFNLRDWRHRAFFNADASRIEMHLAARRNVTVHWNNGQRAFVEGETIHTENSYKYTQQSFLSLLEECGFAQQQVWTDPKHWFMVCHARAV
jgi:dimethylhistidine N-methyltransferase